MKKLFCFFALLFFSVISHADVLLFEDFEDSNITYTTSFSEFSDGATDYFGRIAPDNFTVAPTVQFQNQQGAGYFAAMDTDAPEGSDEDPVVRFSVDIFGYENLRFSALFAEDSAEDGNNDWDANTSILISYTIDNQAPQTMLAFAATGGTNTPAALDSDKDGTGDSILLNDTFTRFASGFIGVGNTLNMEITLNNLDATDEDIAFDNILIEGDLSLTPVPLPATAWLFFSALMGLMRCSYRQCA